MKTTELKRSKLKILLILWAVLLLMLTTFGCADSSTEDTPLGDTLFTEDNYPRVDGSTANIPLGRALAMKLAGVDEDKADLLSVFSTTSNAYYNLVEKQVDIILAYQEDRETLEYINDSNVELEYYPIGWDALVFIVNESNAVESLTKSQIQTVYTGDVTNWASLGGANEPVIAFQRNENSGSQALMRKLVMGNLTMAQAPSEQMPSEMGELIERLSDYDNGQGAIGYSVYYYVQNMYELSGLKLLAIDGVNPSNETIANQTYPYINQFYAVIRKDSTPDSVERKMLNWLLSPEGTKLITEAGYVAANR